MSYLIKLLIENEMAMHDLYAFFAEKYPEHAYFWMAIANDEKHHAQFLEDIQSKNTGVNEKLLNTRQVQNSIDHVKSISKKLESGEEFTILQAVSAAINIENSIVEMNFFKPFDLSPEDVLKSIETIRTETKGHYKKMKDLKDSLR